MKYEVTIENGNKYWRVDGKFHREDGPAVVLATSAWPKRLNGSKEWYINGNLHREDGPAIEIDNGTKYWYINNKLHREDGPAIEFADGSKYWYIDGMELTEKDFNNRKRSLDGKLVTIDGINYKLTEQ
jgi:hypothetical protein